MALQQNGGQALAEAAGPFRWISAQHAYQVRPRKVHNKVEESEVYQRVGVLPEPSEQIALNEKIECQLENLPARFETKQVL